MAKGWGKNGTPDTETGSSGSHNITNLTADENIFFIYHGINDSNSCNMRGTFNAEYSGNKYHWRTQSNGTSGTQIHDGNYFTVTNSYGSADHFGVMFACAPSGEEPIFFGWGVQSDGTAGSSSTNKSNAHDLWGKYEDTSNNITQCKISSSVSGTMATGSNMSSFRAGHTTSPESFFEGSNNSIFEESDTGKHYIWNSSTNTWTEVA